MSLLRVLGAAAFASCVAFSANAITTTAGPGGFDDGWATTITYESDDAVARRGTSLGRNNPLNALGAADGGATGGFFEIGFGSMVDLTFGTTFDTSVSLFEITFGSAAAFPEQVQLLLGSGGSFSAVGFISNAVASGGVTVALGSGTFDTVRLIDNSPLTSSAESDALGALGGFDIDAVRVMSGSPVEPIPLPAGGVLLLTALAGGIALRRRK